jgi:hypothetical protein
MNISQKSSVHLFYSLLTESLHLLDDGIEYSTRMLKTASSMILFTVVLYWLVLVNDIDTIENNVNNE